MVVIGILNINYTPNGKDHHETFKVLKSNFPTINYLEFYNESGVKLSAYLDYSTDTYWVYTVFIPKTDTSTKLRIHSSSTNTSDNSTFSWIVDFQAGDVSKVEASASYVYNSDYNGIITGGAFYRSALNPKPSDYAGFLHLNTESLNLVRSILASDADWLFESAQTLFVAYTNLGPGDHPYGVSCRLFAPGATSCVGRLPPSRTVSFYEIGSNKGDFYTYDDAQINGGISLNNPLRKHTMFSLGLVSGAKSQFRDFDLNIDNTITASTNKTAFETAGFYNGGNSKVLHYMRLRRPGLVTSYELIPPPNPITNLSRTGTLPLVNLTWTASQHATGYRIYVNGTLHGSSGSPSYSLTLTDKGKFTITVTAYNSAGTSAGVDLVDAWVTLPEKPRVKVNTLTHNTISVTSTMPNDLRGYELPSTGYHDVIIFGSMNVALSNPVNTYQRATLSPGQSGNITCRYRIQHPMTKEIITISETFPLKTQDMYHYQISAKNDVSDGPVVTSGTCIGLKYPTFVSEIQQVAFNSTTPSVTIRWTRGVGGNGVDVVAYIIHVYETGQQYRIEGDITEGLITGAVVFGNTYRIKIETRCVVNGTEVSAAVSPEVAIKIGSTVINITYKGYYDWGDDIYNDLSEADVNRIIAEKQYPSEAVAGSTLVLHGRRNMSGGTQLSLEDDYTKREDPLTFIVPYHDIIVYIWDHWM